MFTKARTRRRIIQSHTCKLDLGDDSDSGLPKCDPSASAFRRAFRQFRKLFLASSRNSQTYNYIKSLQSLVTERKRHVRSKNWFIIHPLSIFAAYRELVMIILWLGYAIIEPFIIAFVPDYMPIWGILQLVLLYDVAINFIHGYIDPANMEIVLDKNTVARRYLLTFFIVDLASNIIIPICMATTGTFHGVQGTAAEHCGQYAYIQCSMRLFRMFTAFGYINKVADSFDIKRHNVTMVLIFLTTFVFVHYAACLMVGTAHYLVITQDARDTLIHVANIQYGTSLSAAYTCGLAQACTLFFRCSLGVFILTRVEEVVVEVLILICGHFYFAYIMVVVYDIVRVSRAVGNKYEAIYEQLQTYMLQLKLPNVVRKRILAYYEYRFEKKYFRENAIIDTLSEHLRYEIMLFTCMPLVQKASFFKNLPKHLIGQFIAGMKREVYLCQDVIFKVGDQPEAMFFIYCGTVAAVSKQGYEFLHYEDGDNFGEGDLFSEGKRRYSTVVAEITEIYSLSYHNLRRFLRPYPQFLSQIRTKTQKRHIEAAAIVEKLVKSSQRDKTIVDDTLHLL